MMVTISGGKKIWQIKNRMILSVSTYCYSTEIGRKEMFYLWLYGVRHMVNDHSDSEKGNPLPPHRLLFPISSKGSFIYTIPQTG